MFSLRCITLLLALAMQNAIAEPRKSVRIRRELRQLTHAQLADLWKALWTMKMTDQETGATKFGVDYRPYDYFAVKHATAVLDPRGDQGHGGPCFMTFHRAYLLEMESSMLSVLRWMNSTLDAMPYWDQTLDCDTGVYYKHPEKWIFGSNFFGGYTGNASEGYVVTDGPMARYPVSRFDEALIPKDIRQNVLNIYSGGTFNQIRAPGNVLQTPYVTRFPKFNFSWDGKDGKNDLVYRAADAALCSNAEWIKDWMEWNDCIENARVRGRNNSVEFPWNPKSGLSWLHTQFHDKIGSYVGILPANWGDSAVNKTVGDFFDVVTSANDPVFPFHHTGVDRISRAWQLDAMSKHPDLRKQSWGYPVSWESWVNTSKNWPKELGWEWVWSKAAHEGCALNDVVTSNFPFTRLEGIEKLGGFTHKEILELTSADNAPYTYDTFAPTTVSYASPHLRGAAGK